MRDERWCPVCGKPVQAGQAVLPTPEAVEAGRREARWLADRPEVAAAEAEQAAEIRRRQVEAEDEARQATQPPGLENFKRLENRTRLLRGWLLMFTALGVLEAVLEINNLRVLGRTSAMDYPLSDEVTASEGWLGIVVLVGLGAYLFCAVLWVYWFFPAYRNLRALGAERLRFGDGWAIGGWFVPILGLWRPKQLANDVWRASDPALPAHLARVPWQQAAPPGIFAVWWGAHLASGWAERFSARLSGDWVTLSQAKIGTRLGLMANILEMVAAVLAYRFVGTISRRQWARAERLAELPKTLESPPEAPVASGPV